MRLLLFCALFPLLSWVSVTEGKCCGKESVFSCCASSCNFFCCNCDGDCYSKGSCGQLNVNVKGTDVKVLHSTDFFNWFGKRSADDDQPVPTNESIIFSKLDQNHDGVISYDEALVTVRRKRFAQLDSNVTEWISEELAAMDTNKDGLIEPGEFDASLK